MFLKMRVNENTRRMVFEDTKSIVGVVGDSNVDGIIFYLPENSEYFEFQNAVVYVVFFDATNTSHKQVLDQIDDYSGMPKWTFDDNVLKNDATSQVPFFLHMVVSDTSGKVLKSWNTLQSAFVVYKNRDYNNQEEEAIRETDIDRLAGLVTTLTEKAKTIGDVEKVLASITGSSPKPVDTETKMIDDGHIYLYTGNETGFVTGALYYYIDGDLTYGGVYGSYDLDTTLTEAGKAADAGAVGAAIDEVKEDLSESVTDLKSALDTFDCLPLLKKGYTGNAGTIIGAFHESNNYVTCVLHVMAGDTLTVSGFGTSSARTWAFADANKTITRRAEATTIHNKTVLTAEDGEAYFVYNDAVPANPQPYLTIKINRIATLEEVRGDIDTATDRIGNLEQKTAIINDIAREKRIANNLLTDGINNLLPLSALVYKNGTASEANYGTSGARYLINLGDFKKCHVRFKYRHTAFHPYNGTNVFVSLASLGKNNALHIKDLFQSIMVQSGQIYQNTGHYPANKDTGTTLSLNPLYKKPLIGENALVVSYIGSETISASTTINAVISDTSITFDVNGTVVGTVALNASDTIQSLADAISSVNDFNCIVKNGNGTVGDLMLPAVTISMIDSVSRSGKTVYGTKPIMVPFKIDDSWHTVEFIVNKEAQEAFVAYDGYTGRVGFGTANALTDGMLAVGGNYTTNSEIDVKDLVIDINTYADCELLYGKITNASTTDTRQLISDINPRLMIFEGHGILVGTEAEAQAAYQASGSDTSNEAMQASTERLNIVFTELRKRGYVPVTMQEVIDWKKGISNLPKRCYLCIFDDYRIENYLDYDKRTPFVKNGVKATLAVISDYKALTDTIECNGQTYTVADAIDIISKAGWFTASHTANHLNISQYTVSELLTMLKEDILSCDNHKMNGGVLVYPFGGVSHASLKAVALSDFTLGVSIVEEYYNCKASNDYRLTRTELGTRASLESVLSPFI